MIRKGLQYPHPQELATELQDEAEYRIAQIEEEFDDLET